MRRILSLLFISSCVLLLADNAAAMNAAREALSLWAGQLVPALLPFFICADMLQVEGKRGTGLLLFAVSLTAGAPAAARQCADLPLTQDRRTDLIAACNVAGPMFIYGAFCTAMLYQPRMALPILLAQYLSAALMLLLVQRNKAVPAQAPPPAQEDVPAPFLVRLGASIYKGVVALLYIGGAILFFRVFIAVWGDALRCMGLPPLPPALGVLLTGCIEMANGAALLAKAGLSYALTAALAAFLFSFSGLCILAQSMRFADIAPLRYLGRKMLQGLLSAVLAYGFSYLFLNDAQAVFENSAPPLARNALSALFIGLSACLGMAVVLLLRELLCTPKRQRVNRPSQSR